MKSRSCKAKGRRCVAELVELFLQCFPHLQPEDFFIQTTSAGGKDLRVSPKAFLELPFAVECKNTEKINIWQALEQAKSHVEHFDEIPLVFFKRNRSRLYVALDAESFLRGWGKKR